MLNKKNCWLENIDSTHSNLKISLSDKIEKVLGRSIETNIKDKKCSRNQVSLLADYSSETVTVKHLGENPCCANGTILRKESHVLKHGEILQLITGKYNFKVQFESAFPNGYENHGKQEKRNVEENQLPDAKRICIEKMAAPSCGKNVWERIDDGKLYIFTSVGVKSSCKVAAYDLDGTVIATKSGRVFPKDKDDWLLATGAKAKLIKLSNEDYKIVFLTNQAGIGRGKTNINDFKIKIENIVKALNIPVQVFISTSNSIYRKPAPGMWTFLETEKNDGIKIDMKTSFYVGDAAGRIANWAPGRKKDFSIGDRLLALNLKLKFLTPEEHFLNEPPGKFILPAFNPSELDENCPISDGKIISKKQEVVILVGYPGSGKTHFVLKYLVPAGYAHVNRDTLGTWQKCVLSMEAAVAAGRSVVVDNTNPDRESRQRFVEKTRGIVQCRCFVMSTTIEHVRHNIRFRELTDANHVPVNEMIVNSYKNKLQAPSLEEGFSEIVTINFVPSFSDPDLKKLYRMYLLEK